MSELFRLENGDSSKGRMNGHVARSDGRRGGGGSHAAASPSFLVLL
jgi:hypothetical protein